MGSGSRFRLPVALKRTKSTAKSASQPHEWQPDGKDHHKVQHLLGITETDFNTARNQSISSSATAKLPTLAFSDATTELGSNYPPTDHLDAVRDLQLKASSVLLHEEFLLKGDIVNSNHPNGVRAQGSSSTLNSFYDAQKTPLAISQQTSESSRRDFALRKGSPVVVKSDSPERDSLRQLKLFRLSRSGEKGGSRRLTKPAPEPPANMPSIKQRIPGSSSHITHLPAHRDPDRQSTPKRGVRFNSGRPGESPSPQKSTSKPSARPVHSQYGDVQVKVNIRRPKAGAKHWFDGLEGDSSDDESVHEPELQPSFVAGIEKAFEGGTIAAKEYNEPYSYSSSRALVPPSQGARVKPPPRHMLPPSAIPPRASTLNAKSSKTSLSRREPHVSSPKTKASSLASTDLRHTSVLDLSGSDDEDTPVHDTRSEASSLPPLRDSIAVDSLINSEIEIRTAQAVKTRQNSSLQATPSLKRVRGAPRRDPRYSNHAPSFRRDARMSYYSELSSIPTQEDEDLLTSFPPTPMSDLSLSLQGSLSQERLQSDTASIESRRMMSVTRQEQSLLAAIRSKKAALGQGHGAEPRTHALKRAERKPPMRAQSSPRHSALLDAQLMSQAPWQDRVQSPTLDQNFDQASCTTFQTGPSYDPSIRYSITSARTDIESDTAPSIAGYQRAVPPSTNPPVNRMSRSTFFSTSSNSSQDNARNRKESHYLAALEKLQAPLNRDEVSSQDFIDWPYNGWMKVATAH
jgi:hypothetical protein